MLIKIIPYILWLLVLIDGHFKNLAWNGGPMHVQCEHGLDVWIKGGQHTTENVIATKALVFQDDVYVITPRMKTGIMGTLWLIVQEKNSVELQPYPELRTHKLGDCSAIQNAVDFYLDQHSKLWILDSGVVDTLSAPRCTCPPKVVVISMILRKVIKSVDISSLLEPTSVLQNIVVEHTLGGKTFIYIADASRGSILVHEVTSASEWSVVVCAPAAGLQIALVKRLLHSVLIVVRLHYHGIIEIDTASLRRQDSIAPLTVVFTVFDYTRRHFTQIFFTDEGVTLCRMLTRLIELWTVDHNSWRKALLQGAFSILFGEHSKPVVLLGADGHNVFLRHTECSDVLVWDMRHAYDTSRLDDIHSAGPRLTTTSVTAVPLKPVLLILDSNYLDTLHGNSPTYHKITFITNYHS